MPQSDGRVNLLRLLNPALEHWRTMLLVPLLAGAVTASVVLLSPREWRASMALSTIMNPENLPLVGGISALLNAGNLGGLQATPALMVRLADQYGVLYRVARTPLPGAADRTVIDRIGELDSPVPDHQIVERLRRMIHPSFDKQTGVITLEVVAEDSALARFMAGRLLAEVRETFIRSSRAQATELRRAMEARVDSADRALRHDEEQLRRFLAANRSISPFSPARIEQERLQRTVEISQTTYRSAVSDRESAVAKELEETPAVVVVDPVPDRLVPVRRRLVVKTAVTVMFAAVITWVVLLIRASLAESRLVDAETQRFLRAVGGIPLIGPRLARALAGGAAPDYVRPPSARVGRIEVPAGD